MAVHEKGGEGKRREEEAEKEEREEGRGKGKANFLSTSNFTNPEAGNIFASKQTNSVGQPSTYSQQTTLHFSRLFNPFQV